jgi:hypothetical protein
VTTDDQIEELPTQPGMVPITDDTVEEAVAHSTFRWAPVLIERSPRPKALYLPWRSFLEVFDEIDDPRNFPPLPSEPPDEDIAVFRRYITAAEDLAESELLCASDSMTVSWDDERNEEAVTASWTSNEITRGFAVLLRQFDSQGERASFQGVANRLRKLSGEMVDSHERRRCAQIDAWRAAQGVLHGTELRRLAIRKIEPSMEYGNEHPPTYYLSAYNYGELIHWDSKRDTLAEWAKDPYDHAKGRMAFLEAASGLTYVYIGFSELVRRAISPNVAV